MYSNGVHTGVSELLRKNGKNSYSKKTSSRRIKTNNILEN